ncbi:MAG: aconitate hydratase, partial [Chlamydiae bacterium]|nr:aconitate hydratase [Chlamydiota bacterium]
CMEYAKRKIPLIVFAGKDYGMGSSRDWAAKGTALLGIRAVVAQSFERIHRSNLIGMGIFPLRFQEGESWDSLAIDGTELFSLNGSETLTPRQEIILKVERQGAQKEVKLISCIETPQEAEYYQHGGILPYVLRQFL